MSVKHIVQDASRLLDGIEEGTLNTADAVNIARNLDPVLLHWIFKYLRDKYPAGNQASQGVLSRLLDLTSTYPDLVKTAKKGGEDMITEWFAETFATADFYSQPEEMLTHLVEKIEG